jgi:molybdopterin-guanine dinucleotide biosynthesis adapter protein
MVLIVAAVGRSGSGKTVTLEYLISQLTKEGYRVGAIKHVHHKGFTIDTEGKNTWRYTQAGAKIVAAISPDEVAIIKKTPQKLNNLDQIIETISKDGLDLIFIEGYHGLIAKKGDISKIIVAKDLESLKETMEGTVEPILAVSGLVAKNMDAATIEGLQVIRIPEDGKRLVELVKQQFIKTQKLH